MPVDPLLHLVPAGDFDVAGTAPYAPASLEAEGFVHCSTPDQVAGTARLLFAGHDDLLLLVVDPRLLDGAEVLHEDLYGVGQPFPHVYGPVPRQAIVEVRPFPPGRGGRWSRPDVAPLA
jgi:uncharacterized protein (DUF952 family)